MKQCVMMLCNGICCIMLLDDGIWWCMTQCYTIVYDVMLYNLIHQYVIQCYWMIYNTMLYVIILCYMIQLYIIQCILMLGS